MAKQVQQQPAATAATRRGTVLAGRGGQVAGGIGAATPAGSRLSASRPTPGGPGSRTPGRQASLAGWDRAPGGTAAWLRRTPGRPGCQVRSSRWGSTRASSRSIRCAVQVRLTLNRQATSRLEQSTDRWALFRPCSVRTGKMMEDSHHWPSISWQAKVRPRTLVLIADTHIRKLHHLRGGVAANRGSWRHRGTSGAHGRETHCEVTRTIAISATGQAACRVRLPLVKSAHAQDPAYRSAMHKRDAYRQLAASQA
jgi:hypothetical protein